MCFRVSRLTNEAEDHRDFVGQLYSARPELLAHRFGSWTCGPPRRKSLLKPFAFKAYLGIMIDLHWTREQTMM